MYRQQLQHFPLPLLLDVFAAVPVLLDEKIADSKMTYDKAIAAGLLINSVTDRYCGTLRPTISEVQLRLLYNVLTSSPTTLEVSWSIASDVHRVLDNVRRLLTLRPNSHGKLLNPFHMRWEMIRRTCLKIRASQGRRLPRWSIAKYYHCAAATGELVDRELDLQEALTDMAFFKKHTELGVPPLRISRNNIVTEFPPSFQEVSMNEMLLFHVWKPRSENYPAIDFVIFVRVCDRAGQVTIIALVFRSKYSNRTITAGQVTEPKPDGGQPMDRGNDESESDDDGAFKSSIGWSVVDKAYKQAKKIMAHVGWTDDKFIYVVHVYPVTAGLMLLQAVGTNSMILDAKSLEKLYGCLGDVLKNLSLRCQTSCAAARRDEENPLEDSKEENDEDLQQLEVSSSTVAWSRQADDLKLPADADA
jgi:hypothetical protein